MTGIDHKAERRLAARTAESDPYRSPRDYLAAADWSHVTFLASTTHRPTVQSGLESGMVQVALTSRGSGLTVTLFREQARQLLDGLAAALADDGGGAAGRVLEAGTA